MPLLRRRLRLPVRLSMAVWLRESCRWPRSSASFSTTLLLSRSGVGLSINRRPAVGVIAEGPVARPFKVDETKRRRGKADDPNELLSAACAWVGYSRGVARKPLTSVAARDGARNLVSSSSSSSAAARRALSRVVLRPSSGSSVAARRVLSNSDDFRPDGSSGSSVPPRRDRPISRDDLLPEGSSYSSVPARRVRASRSDDFRPASIGVLGAAANLGLGSAVGPNSVVRLCSRLVPARGLELSRVRAWSVATAFGRRWLVFAENLVTVGLVTVGLVTVGVVSSLSR